MKKKIKYSIFIICLTMFILLSILVINKRDFIVDSFIYGSIESLINKKTTSIVKVLTYFGSAYPFILLIVLSLFLKDKKYFKYLSINLILITVLNITMKSLFARPRPLDISLVEETGYSFPSGHSLTSMAFYGLLIYLITTSNLSRKLKIILNIILSLLILIVGLSRIYLGVHYFTDVIGGFLLAIIYLIIFISVLENKKLTFLKKD